MTSGATIVYLSLIRIITLSGAQGHLRETIVSVITLSVAQCSTQKIFFIFLNILYYPFWGNYTKCSNRTDSAVHAPNVAPTDPPLLRPHNVPPRRHYAKVLGQTGSRGACTKRHTD